MRFRLPYGKWTCSAGREVLFNRNYHPIWQRQPDGSVSAADRSERVQWCRQEWFYDDGNPPWVNKESLEKCEAILCEWVALIDNQSVLRQFDEATDGADEARWP
jgi:hypothetical protein